MFSSYFCLLKIKLTSTIPGNLSALYILWSPSRPSTRWRILKRQTSLHLYLQWLALADLLFLLTNLVFLECECLDYYLGDHIPSTLTEATFLRIAEPLHRFFTGPSDYIVIFMTLDRSVLHITMTLRMRSMRALPNYFHPRKMKKVTRYVMLSFAIGFIFNLPSFFAYTSGEFDCSSRNITQSRCFEKYVPRFKDSEVETLQDLWIAYTVINIGVMSVLPLFSIFILNIAIIKRLRDARSQLTLRENKIDFELVPTSTTGIFSVVKVRQFCFNSLSTPRSWSVMPATKLSR